ncbi:hypothetical protein DFJ74DRAFT_702245 [Hyaloraphidium curvatum]|nr:hypothetical protein DFJ74DRAFT_702245 [Hyaloraphidium curvatum]
MDRILQDLAEALSREQRLVALPPELIVPLFEHPQPPKSWKSARSGVQMAWGGEGSGGADATSGGRTGGKQPAVRIGQVSLKLGRVTAALRELGQEVPWEPAQRAAADGAHAETKEEARSPRALAEAECGRIVAAFRPTAMVASCSRHELVLHFHLDWRAFLRYMLEDRGPAARSDATKGAAGDVTVVYPRFPADRPLNALDLRFVAAGIYLSRQLSAEGNTVTFAAISDPAYGPHLQSNLDLVADLGGTISLSSADEVASLPPSHRIAILHERGTKSDLFAMLSASRPPDSLRKAYVGRTSWSPGPPPDASALLASFRGFAASTMREKNTHRPDAPSLPAPAVSAALASALARAAVLFPHLARGLDGPAALPASAFALPDTGDAGGGNDGAAAAAAGIFVHYVRAKLASILASTPPAAEEGGVEQPEGLREPLLLLARAPHRLPRAPGGDLCFGVPDPAAAARHLHALAGAVSSATYAVRVKGIPDGGAREGRRRGYAALAAGLAECCGLLGLDAGGVGEARM